MIIDINVYFDSGECQLGVIMHVLDYSVLIIA